MESPAKEIVVAILSQPIDPGTKCRLIVGVAQELTVEHVIESLVMVVTDMGERMAAPLRAHYRD
jgi:hypothetical protein